MKLLLLVLVLSIMAQDANCKPLVSESGQVATDAQPLMLNALRGNPTPKKVNPSIRFCTVYLKLRWV